MASCVGCEEINQFEAFAVEGRTPSPKKGQRCDKTTLPKFREPLFELSPAGFCNDREALNLIAVAG